MRRSLSDLLAVDPIVLHLPSVNCLHVQSVPEYKGHTEPLAQISDPVPDENALYCDRQIVAVRFDEPGKCGRVGRSLRSLLAQTSRVGFQVLVHQDRPCLVGDANVHLRCVKIDPAVVFVTVPEKRMFCLRLEADDL